MVLIRRVVEQIIINTSLESLDMSCEIIHSSVEAVTTREVTLRRATVSEKSVLSCEGSIVTIFLTDWDGVVTIPEIHHCFD